MDTKTRNEKKVLFFGNPVIFKRSCDVSHDVWESKQGKEELEREKEELEQEKEEFEQEKEELEQAQAPSQAPSQAHGINGRIVFDLHDLKVSRV